MRIDRMMRIARSSVALVILALALVFLGLALTAPPAHASGVSVRSGGDAVEFGKNVYVGPGERVKSAVAFGGDITVAGTVQQSAVAFGGDVTVSGRVEQSVVAFGGDIHLTPTAVVGTGMNAGDSTVVTFGGDITQEKGAQVTGHTKQVSRMNWTGAIGAIGSTGWSTWFGFSLVGWLVQTAICLVLALVVAALMPKQLLAVQRNLAARPAASLGWGALTFFVIVPVALVVLVVSIIGILVAIPLLVFVLLSYFFVTTGVAALLARKVLGSRGQNLMLAVAVGVVGTTVISRIPVAGGIALLAMTVLGAGAGVLAFAEWRRDRRLAAAPAGPGAPGGPAGDVPGGPGGYPAAPVPGAPSVDAAGQPAALTGQGYAPAAAPTAAQTAVAEPVTAAQIATAEPQTAVQPADAEPGTQVAAPAVEAPEPPAAPAAPDASQLPSPSSHAMPPMQPPAAEE